MLPGHCHNLKWNKEGMDVQFLSSRVCLTCNKHAARWVTGCVVIWSLCRIRCATYTWPKIKRMYRRRQVAKNSQSCVTKDISSTTSLQIVSILTATRTNSGGWVYGAGNWCSCISSWAPHVIATAVTSCICQPSRSLTTSNWKGAGKKRTLYSYKYKYYQLLTLLL